MERRAGFRLSIGRRLALGIFGIGTVVSVALAYLQARAATKALQDRTAASSHVILETLESLSRTHLSIGDVRGLRNELVPLIALPRIAYIDVFDAKGRPLIQLQSAHLSHGRQRDPDIASVTDDVLDLETPVAGTDAHVELGISTRGLREDAVRIRRESLVTASGLCLVLAIGSWIAGAWLGRRLHQFADVVKKTPLDAYDHLSITGGDEVADLARAFNERQDRLRQLDAERAAAEENRRSMTAMIIHDLKGPLAGFSGGVSMLQEMLSTSGDPELRKLLALMQRGTARVLRMIDSILQVARLEDESVPIVQQPLDVASLVRRRGEESALTAHARAVQVKLEVPETPVETIGDAELLGRVVENLVFNAIEHSPAGGTVTVRLTPLEGSAEIQVRDEGPGLGSVAPETLFEKFRKGERTSQGVGLGLAFCKLAVARHQGFLRAANASPRGAIFTVTIPARARAGAAAGPAAP